MKATLTSIWTWLKTLFSGKFSLPDPIQWDKYWNELQGFWLEMYVENHVQRRRYGKVSQWPRLFTDFWVSLYSMSYTLGHITILVLIFKLIVWLNELGHSAVQAMFGA